MKKGGSFLEGWLFRPQGQPMEFPYTYSAKLSQFPYKFYFRQSFMVRYFCYSFILMTPLIYSIHKMANSPENTAFWREKRKHDDEHHKHEMEKLWEKRT